MALDNKEKKVWMLMYLLFITPIIPFGAICYFGSSTDIRYRRYILTVATGVIPSIVTSNLIGAGARAFIMNALPLWVLILIILLMMALLFVLLWLFLDKVYFRGKDGTPDSAAYFVAIKLIALWRKHSQKLVVDGEKLKAPGWIGGGGGTVTAANDKWYDFQEFDGGEYDFETSGPVHVKFKFLLADSGQCWSEEMEDPNFLIMRWGIANESDLYIDNLVFFDEDGNSIPVQSGGSKIEEKLEEAGDKIKDEAQKAKEELQAEYEKAVEDMKNSEDYEAAKAKIDEIKQKLEDFKSDENMAELEEKISQAEAEIKEKTSQAQAAIEEASKMIEEAKNN